MMQPAHRSHDWQHDYCERGIYHITLVCSDRCWLLGRIVGDGPATARCELTPLGAEVSREIGLIGVRCGERGLKVRVLAKVVMPEHVHFVLFVEERMPCKLQKVMRGFKQGCNKRLRYWLQRAEVAAAQRLGAGREVGCGGREVGNLALPNGDLGNGDLGNGGLAGSAAARFLALLLALRSERVWKQHALFESDFDDTPLYRRGQLRAMIDYVHNNPRHRWLRSHYRNLLLPTRGIVIDGRTFDAIGNVGLLARERRRQVWVRSRWDEATRRDYMNGCIVEARRGAVLVSPFISRHEVAVRDAALREGLSVIVVVGHRLADVEQCPGGLYDYCLDGLVLMLAPADACVSERQDRVRREECVALNDLAAVVAAESYNPKT